ncbi:MULTISPECIES: TetR/AcrR family transcriptional regulator [Streptomyces]|uniref:TetR/AcrR family transcriptional regulator n=1 Tax=Streptomyces changanensis TaxID=2964669 RepID=A0ABY5N2H2_9ACTN|nr:MULTISPECIES: TetR/AcrR family transcriptional regulator [Streptomyces]UUS30721.1 TetR/AcrR family transcriptional regulator [Streptomyces changanensis]
MTTGVRRRMGVEERRQQLIGVALELFSHRSPDEVSIDEIAAAAGISRPLVYHYFPGKQSLYEAALRRAADDLASRFAEPHDGPLGARLVRVMGRFFDFVEEHGPGFSALMRGGPAGFAAGARADGAVPAAYAMIDGVRRAAREQILDHLGVRGTPPARLDLVVRSWVALAESTALIWLDGRRVPRGELEVQLVHDFAALAAVSAAYDADMAALVTRMLADEPADGPFGDLVGRLATLLATATATATATAKATAGTAATAGAPVPAAVGGTPAGQALR